MENKSVNYRLKPFFSIIVHSPNNVELRKGVWNSVSYALNDDTQSNKLAKIILSLDGTKTVSEICEQQGIKRSEIEGLIDHLRRLDVIEMGVSNLIDYYTEEAQLPFPGVDTKSKQPVVFIGDKQINDTICQQIKPYLHNEQQIRFVYSEDPLYQMLLTQKAQEFEQEIAFQKNCEMMESFRGSLFVFTIKNVNPNLLLAFNRLAFETGINWMHGCIDGPMLYIGPMFFTERGPCYCCLEKRIGMNIIENNSYVEYKKALFRNDVRAAEFVTPVLANLLASHLSLEIINYVLTKNSYLCNRVLSFYLPTKEFSYNELLRFPDCPVCGSMVERDSRTTYFDKQVVLEG